MRPRERLAIEPNTDQTVSYPTDAETDVLFTFLLAAHQPGATTVYRSPDDRAVIPHEHLVRTTMEQSSLFTPLVPYLEAVSDAILNIDKLGAKHQELLDESVSGLERANQAREKLAGMKAEIESHEDSLASIDVAISRMKMMMASLPPDRSFEMARLLYQTIRVAAEMTEEQRKAKETYASIKKTMRKEAVRANEAMHRAMAGQRDHSELFATRPTVYRALARAMEKVKEVLRLPEDAWKAVEEIITSGDPGGLDKIHEIYHMAFPVENYIKPTSDSSEIRPIASEAGPELRREQDTHPDLGTFVRQVLEQARRTAESFEVGGFRLRTLVNTENPSLPPNGRFSIRVEYPEAVDAFKRMATEMANLPGRLRSEMISSLEFLAEALRMNRYQCPYLTSALFTTQTRDEMAHFNRAITVDNFIEGCQVAIANLQSPEPALDNYDRFFLKGEVSGSDPVSREEVVNKFLNPFAFSIIVLLHPLPGAKHKAVDKVKGWIHVKNDSCEDFECIPNALRTGKPAPAHLQKDSCIPKALAVKSFDLVEVPPADIEKVSRAVLEPASFSDLAAVYRTVFAELSVPWVVVGATHEDGSWEVVASSIPPPHPNDFAGLQATTVFLHTNGKHMTRIVELVSFDEVGWIYSLVSFAVVGKIGEGSGVGSAIPKMMLGHSSLTQAGLCHIGLRVCEYLVSTKEDPGSSATSVGPCPIHLQRLSTWKVSMLAIEDTLDAAYDEGGDETLGGGVIRDELVDHVSVEDLEGIDILREAGEEWLRRCDISARSDEEDVFSLFNWSSILRLPNWIIVTDLHDETWTVVSASDRAWMALCPTDVDLATCFVFYCQRPAAGRPWNWRTMTRVVDLHVTSPEGTKSSARRRFGVVWNSSGLEQTLEGRFPDLITSEEISAAASASTDQEMADSFKAARCVVINDVLSSSGGLVRSFKTTGRKGRVETKEILEGAEDLLRFWVDPDGAHWLITGRKFYDIDRLQIRSHVQATLYMAIDYETVNRGSTTVPSLIAYTSWRSVDPPGQTKSECFEGADCDRRVVVHLEDYLGKSSDKIQIITFNGALFDMHFWLHALAKYGNFGESKQDRHVSIGNRLLEIQWRGRVRIVDMRRFTGMSLADVSRELGVKTPKSKVNLSFIQKTFEDSGCEMRVFFNALDAQPSSILLEGIHEDSKIPGFVEKISGMTARKAYSAYCINDTEATLQCWLKLRAGSLAIPDVMSMSEAEKSECRHLYDIDHYSTIPGMAYRIYRETLPSGDFGKIEPPVPASLDEYKLHKYAGYGGRSAVYSFVDPGLVKEPHSVEDAISLYPFAGMVARMPVGEAIYVIAPGCAGPSWLTERAAKVCGPPPCGKCENCRLAGFEIRELPVPDLIGTYFCMIHRQPDGICLIPKRTPGKPLNWDYHDPFEAPVNVATLLAHRILGGEIEPFWGVYYPGLRDDLFDGSLRRWKEVKMHEDEVREECLQTLAKEKKASAVSADRESEIMAPYHPLIRFMAKLLSNALLGRTAKKLKEVDQKLLYGDSAFKAFQSTDLAKKPYCVHLLAEDSLSKPADQQLRETYEKAMMVTIDLDQEADFASLNVPEVIISETMLAFAQIHMAVPLRRFIAARSVRGVETDGIHCNQALYEAWCEKESLGNPYWLPGLFDLPSAKDHQSEIFKPGNPYQASCMARLGSMRNSSRAAVYAKARGLPGSFPPPDYGDFKEEVGSNGLFEVSYPFRKFYMYTPVGTPFSPMTTRMKGVGRSTRLGEAALRHQFGLAYDALKGSPASPALAKKAVDLKSPAYLASQRKIVEASPLAFCRETFERLTRGEGVDVVDYRFQGQLGKLGANLVSYGGELEKKQISESPLHYGFATKRVEPHPFFIVSARDGGLFLRDYRLSEAEEKEVYRACGRALFPSDGREEWISALLLQRGFTIQTKLGSGYIKNSLIKACHDRAKEEWTPVRSAPAAGPLPRQSFPRGDRSLQPGRLQPASNPRPQGVLSASAPTARPRPAKKPAAPR